ncbi:MAG: GPI anchored serine-threonine rich family protein [Methanococcaceae archaeon]
MEVKILLPFCFLIALTCGCRKIFDSGTSPDNSKTYKEEKPIIYIAVTSPLEGEKFIPGTQLPIKWNSSPVLANVNIELYKKSDYIMTIVQGNANDGAVLWTIPSDIRPSVHYKIKISNSNDENDFGYSNTFSILLSN